jgi:hypothetical protein
VVDPLERSDSGAGEGHVRNLRKPLTRLNASRFATLSPLRGARESPEP